MTSFQPHNDTIFDSFAFGRGASCVAAAVTSGYRALWDKKRREDKLYR